MLVVRADGCSLCLPLDAVVNVIEHGAETELPGEVRTWSGIAGLEATSGGGSTTATVSLHSTAGIAGLAIEKCVGVREVSLRENTPIPTQLVDGSGSPLCHLLLLDGQPHFLLEPRALLETAGGIQPTRPAVRAPGLVSARLSAEG